MCLSLAVLLHRIATETWLRLLLVSRQSGLIGNGDWEAWNAWEHHVDVYEKLATSKLNHDLKIIVVLREAPTKLRDKLPVTSQQLKSNFNKLREFIQAYLNSTKSWTANDFRNGTKESDPMEVDHISKGKGKIKGNRQQQKHRKE